MKLQNDIVDLHGIIAAMRCEIDDLKKQSVPSVSAEPSEMRSQITTEVHKVMQDTDKRKRNVIVSGIVEAEDSQIDDTTAFTATCEEHLHIKRATAGCVRLGKRGPNAPRRLLVRLHRENSAVELLKSARSLRNADDPAVRKNIYINQDLAPAAAKLAYEERQRRRQTRSAATTSSDGTGAVHQQHGHLSVNAVPFQPNGASAPDELDYTCQLDVPPDPSVAQQVQSKSTESKVDPARN